MVKEAVIEIIRNISKDEIFLSKLDKDIANSLHFIFLYIVIYILLLSVSDQRIMISYNSIVIMIE
jgi:hypothetical protein